LREVTSDDPDRPSGRVARATVLFADVVGFTELSERDGPERAYFALTGALRILDQVARRHGASVDKYLGDSLMAVFGHPVPIAEPARAAASAALEMREQLARYVRALGASLDLVIGINTGSLVAGDVRGHVIREFHVLGDTVNVAARLKARAPLGSVYAGPQTRSEAGPGFAWRDAGSFRPKGKTVDVTIFELAGSLAPRAGRGTGPVEPGPGFVGRVRELARIAARLEALGAGTGGVLFLTGEQGAGKSRLLATAATAPEAQKLELVHARPAADADSPLQLVSDLLDACGGDARSNAADEADESVPIDLAVAANTLRARAAARPLAIVLEDLYCAEAATLDAVEALVRELAGDPILWIFVLRAHGARPDDALARLRARPDAEELALRPLSAGESAQLVEAAGGGSLDSESCELVIAHGGGNPARLILGAFLAPALRAEREEQRRSERAEDAERRRATILFADITGFTSMTERIGAERAYPIVVRCLRLLDEIARQHGGTVEKYLGDCVMALFGVPEAIEDAPRAAVNAAIEMRRRVRLLAEEMAGEIGGDVRLDVHTGINTGLGIAGDISGPLIREFAVMGEPVSVADELKDLAPAGTIWVGLEVQRATRDVFEFRELPAVAVARRTAQLPAFEVLSQQQKLHRARVGAERRLFSGLVGRDRELALLRGCLERLHAGQGGIANVIAEAGLGKSRLVAEVAASDAAHGVAWREGRSISSGRHASLHPIADLLRAWIGIDDDDDDAEIHAKLDAAIRRTLPDDVDEALPPIASILGVRLEPALQARLDALQGDALQKLILRSVTQLLRAASAVRPLVIVMDDLHWADQSSIELLEALLRLCEEHPILFLNLFRRGAEGTSERIRAAAHERHPDRCVEIELRPLDASATRSLLNNLFRQGDIPHATRHLIEQKAQGNPFFVEEVVRSLVDEGAVEIHDGRFRATERIHEVAIPGTIQEVVMARVDALPLRKRQLLQTASVVGLSFHVDVVRAVVGESDVSEPIRALEEAEFLVPSDRLPGEEFAFKHPLLQEVIYDGLLHARRQDLHERVAEAIERQMPPDVPGYEGMLALHFGKGGEIGRAEEYLFRAGDRAARAAAPSEALHFFEEASKLYLQLHADGGDPGKRALLESRIANALYYRGRFVEAIEHFNRALVLLGDRVAEGGLRIGAHFARNLAAVLLRLYGPRVRRSLPPATDRQREILGLRYARAEATVTAQPTRHLFDSMDTLALLQRIDPATVPGSGRLYAGAAALFAFAGLSFDVSRRLGAKARALVARDDADESLYQLAMDFTCRVLEGDWSDAHEIDPERVEESVRKGQLWGPTTYLGLLGEKRIHQGAFEAARACIDRIDHIWDLFQYDLAKTNHYYLRTLLPLERGAWSQAIEAANAYYDENPEDLLHILALSARAKAETAQGDLDAAEVSLGLASSILASSGPVPPFHASAYHRSQLVFDVARLARAVEAGSARDRRRAKRRALRSARTARRSAAKVAWHRPEVLRLTARVYELLGNDRRALRLLDRAVRAAEQMGAQPELARAYAVVAPIVARGRPNLRFFGNDAEQCRARARNGFDTFGLT
jgi:class 3 adenylate cyclase/predicted ATPase